MNGLPFVLRLPTPLRRVYALLVAATVLVRLPWWIVTNLTPAQRPRKSWTLTHAIVRNVTRFLLDDLGQVNLEQIVTVPTYKELVEGCGGVYVDAVPELITGEVKGWAEKAGVASIRIPGYWTHKEGTKIAVGQRPEKDEKVVYFLHGGGYTSFSAHPKIATTNIPRGLLKFVPSVTRSFAIEYRLSSLPPEPVSGQFPSALLDAIAGYNYLVNEVGYDASQVIVVGDSAGGNLGQALTRYLVEHRGTVPGLPDPPGVLVLLSPWTDMTGSHSSPGSSVFTHRASDFITIPDGSLDPLPPHAFIEPFGPDLAKQTPYLSYAKKYIDDVSFDGFPRTFIAAGSAEVLFDQVRTLQGRMKAQLGEEKVMYFEVKDAFHDWLTFTLTEPWRSDTLRAIARFVEDTN